MNKHNIPEPIKGYRYTNEEILQYFRDLETSPKADGDKPYHRGVLTGAFDPWHFCHGRAIQQAAQMCDQLIVAVSDDHVIDGYKGKHYMPLEQRLEAISYIKGVTLAIPQYDLYNKVELLQSLGADVLFSCEEYQRSFYEDESSMTAKERAGVERWEQFEKEVGEYGIDVVYLPRHEEMSSTKMKELLIKQNNLQEPQGVMLYSEGECCGEASVCL